MTGAAQAPRWVVVADSTFLPARGGGEREHLGFVRAAGDAGWLAALVLPVSGPLDVAPYEQLARAPVLLAPRRRSPVLLVHPRSPYVVASRPPPPDLPGRLLALESPVTGVVAFSYKSWRIGQLAAQVLGVPMVLRQHNREADYHRSLAAGLTGPRRLVMRWEAARIQRDEARLEASGTVLATADISLADAVARRAAGARNVLHVPPFAYDASLAAAPVRRPHPGGASVLFVGALDVVTNTSALTWLLEQVWPLVLAGAPQARLEVVGRSPSVDLRRRLAAVPGVELHADVPSLAPHLERADVAVNPAVSGSGVNIKLVDYLQAGLPLVSTSLATAGLPLEPGRHLEVHDTAAGFAQAVLALLADPDAAARLGAAGRRRIEELLEPAANLRHLAAAFDLPAAGSPAPDPPAPDSARPVRDDAGTWPFEVVLVTYRSRPLVEQLLATLPADLPVVVVDNSSDVDPLADLATGRPALRYLDGGGVGFSRAANLGARSSTADYLVFLNPDVTATAEQLRTLVAALQADSTLGAVSAATRLADGRMELGAGGWEPTVRRTIVHALGLHTLLPSAGVWLRPVPGREYALEWLSGACLAVPRAVFTATGGFDESFFVYNEDMAYGRRLRTAGYRQRQLTSVVVGHLGGGSGGSSDAMLRQRARSMMTYLAQHNPPAATAAMRVALTAGWLLRAVAAAVRTRSLRDMPWAYAQGLWQAGPAQR